METTNNKENSKKQLSHDSHSVLNTSDRTLVAKVEESSFLNFLKKYGFVLIVLLIFLVVGFFLVNRPTKNITIETIEQTQRNIKYIIIAGQKIKVDLATTEVTREQGLSGRTSLSENEGLLFVFDQPGKYGFWMKDMNFPIDIIWLDGDKRVVYIKKDARPELYPEAYTPLLDAKYVLEVVDGFSDKYNLKVGDRVGFEY